MYPSNYDMGFMQGVTIRNLPIEIAQTGQTNVWWVDSVHGSNGNKGNFMHPLATLAYAMANKVKAGDRVFVAAGHEETVTAAAGILFNVDDVVVQFLGEGSDRASITFSTATTASISITGNGVTLINPHFIAGIDALSAPISVAGPYCTIINGEWHDAPAKAAVHCIVATGAAFNLKVCGWKYFASTTGTQKVDNISLTNIADPYLSNIDIVGDFSTANINNATTACVDLRLENVILKNTNTTPKPGIVLQAATTGQAKNVDIRIYSGSTYVSSVAAMNWDDNCLGYAANGTSGELIGTLSYGAGSSLAAIGSEFIVKKTLAATAIVQGGVDVTGASSGGELLIEEVVLMTDSTGLATATAVQLVTNNTNGAAIFAQETVANLGASVTVSAPSAVNKKVVLESGKKISIKSTVADCSGGSIVIYLKCQRLSAGATVAAA